MSRKWLAAITLFSVSALFWGISAEIPAQDTQTGSRTDSEALAITHGPYLQLPGANTMTVVWHTNRKCVSRVEYGIDDSFGMTAISSRNGLIDNDRTSHVIRLTGLKPGAKYKYRAVSREFGGYKQQHIVTFGETVATPIYEFTTLDPAKENFSFSMISDIHERAQDLELMLHQNSFAGIDFAIYNGDMLNDFMRLDQVFTGFIDVSVKSFASEMPFVYARGNHETRGRFARNLTDYLPVAGTGFYFSFDHAGVHFIVLDSGEDKEDGHQYYNGLVDFQNYRKREAEWLSEDLNSSACRNARFRIVISHIPPQGAKGFAVQDVRDSFEPLINKAGIDLWLSGHTHRFQRLEPVQGQNSYPLIIGSTDSITRVDVSRVSLKVTVTRQSGEVLLPALQIKGGRRNRQTAQ